MMPQNSQVNSQSTTPRCPWRLLGIPGEVVFSITDHLSIYLPRHWHLPMGTRIQELGYNSLLFLASTTSQAEPCKGHEILSQVKALGLKLFVQPTLNAPFAKSPANPDYRTLIDLSIRELLRTYPQLDGIYWVSSLYQPDYTSHSDARDALMLDLLLQELTTVEKALNGKKKLIFSVPTASIETAEREVGWLERLCDDAGLETMVAFSSVAGDPLHDHLPSHPFWNRLRRRSERVVTPLLPIINTGGLSQGEGLWPSIGFDLFENYFTHLRGHHFGGVINLTNRIPEVSGFLACNLWVAGQMMQGADAPEWIIEEWFRRHKSSWNYALLRQTLRQMRALVIELSRLKHTGKGKLPSEEYRVLIDSLFLQFKQLQTTAARDPTKKSTQESSLKTYVDYFSRDGRRLLKHFSQQHNVGSAQLWSGEEKGESFWTDQMGTQIKLLAHPNQGSPGSKMEIIYKETYMDDVD